MFTIACCLVAGLRKD